MRKTTSDLIKHASSYHSRQFTDKEMPVVSKHQRTNSTSGKWGSRNKVKREYSVLASTPSPSPGGDIRCWQRCKVLGASCDLLRPLGTVILEYILELKYAYPVTQQFHFLPLSYRNKSIIYKGRREKKSFECPLTEERLNTLCGGDGRILCS